MSNDEFDDDLAAAIRGRAGTTSRSTANAHDAVLRRATSIRRRRAGFAGSGLAAVAIGGILLLPRTADEGTIDLADTIVGVDSTLPESTITSVSTVPTTSVARTVAVTVAVTTSPPPTSASTTSTSSTTPNPTTSTTVDDEDETEAPAPFTETYSSSGGSITVSWNGSSLSLGAVSPAPAYEAEVEDDSATRIRVRFEIADDDSQIEVRVEDGELSVDID